MTENLTTTQDLRKFIRSKFKLNWNFEILNNGVLTTVVNFSEIEQAGAVEFILYDPSSKERYKAIFNVNTVNFELLTKESNDYHDGFYYSVSRDLSADWISFECEKYGEDMQAICFDALDQKRMKKIACSNKKRAELLRQIEALNEQDKNTRAYYDILKSKIGTSGLTTK